jgi:hypothetical protein
MIYCSAYFQLVKNIFFFFAITGGKCALIIAKKHVGAISEMENYW